MDFLQGECEVKDDKDGTWTLALEGTLNQQPPNRGSSSSRDSIDQSTGGRVIGPSMEELLLNVCEIHCSGESLSSDGFWSSDESKIDVELCRLAGVGGIEEEARTEVEIENKKKYHEVDFKKQSSLPLGLTAFVKCSAKNTSSPVKDTWIQQYEKTTRRQSTVPTMGKHGNLVFSRTKFRNGSRDIHKDDKSHNKETGFSLLEQVSRTIISGGSPHKALEIALQATKWFEECSNRKHIFDQVMCLRVLASVYCYLGQHERAIPLVKKSNDILKIDDRQDHVLAGFSGSMQLGDIYAMLGQIDEAVNHYTSGLKIQRQLFGEADARVGAVYRYIAEVHLQYLQFDEAERFCDEALSIHKAHKHGSPSTEEAADRRLMGLICDAKGDHRAALEHYFLASTAMATNSTSEKDAFVAASIDCNIGDSYLSLGRYNEASFAYQKSLDVFKLHRGENHVAVASVLARLGDLSSRKGNFQDSRTHCENALRIYAKSDYKNLTEEIANGFIHLSATYQSLNEPDRALSLLKKAFKIYSEGPTKSNIMAAGIEAQMGILFFTKQNYAESCTTLRNSVSKFRAGGFNKSALFGIALNQFGLACTQCCEVDTAATLFEEARSILEAVGGPHHPDTLAVYSNLAATYDAMGRSEDAIEILEYSVRAREAKLGTANTDADDEKRRLTVLLHEGGRSPNKKSVSLVDLLDKSHAIIHF